MRSKSEQILVRFLEAGTKAKSVVEVNVAAGIALEEIGGDDQEHAA